MKRLSNAARPQPPDPEKHIYLAGAIEYAPDGGKAWRAEIAPFLRQLGYNVFNPCVNEEDLLTPEEKLNFRIWKSEDFERHQAVVRRIIEHDLNMLLRQTQFVVCYWDEHVTKGTGTAGELTVAYRHGIPVYMLAGLPRHTVSSWVLGCATEVFDSWDELRDFLSRDANVPGLT